MRDVYYLSVNFWPSECDNGFHLSLSLSSIFTLCFHNSGISFLSTYPSSIELEGTLLGTGEGRKWKRERGRGERERMWSGEV